MNNIKYSAYAIISKTQILIHQGANKLDFKILKKDKNITI